MTTFALLHGSGDGGWTWHLVQRALRQRGHEAVAPDLPTEDDGATWDDCVDAVVTAVDGAQDVVVVGHSSGGFLVPLVTARLDACAQVYVAGMVPRPGESPIDWFASVGWSQAVARAGARDGGLTGHPDPQVVFLHDVPAPLAAQASARERPVSGRLGAVPWPGGPLPEVPAHYVVTTLDRFLPPALQRRVAAERAGVAAPDELEAGHCANLSRPEGLADLLAACVVDRSGA